jgi:hypothetical protein
MYKTKKVLKRAVILTLLFAPLGVATVIQVYSLYVCVCVCVCIYIYNIRIYVYIYCAAGRRYRNTGVSVFVLLY